ncbi:flagellar biosynthetic protein FliO, partial [Azorhizobium caulinodans]
MLQDLFGAQLELPARVAIALVVIAALLALTMFLVRRIGGGGGRGGIARSRHRLAVLDSVPVDQRRRLVLVRRDEVEHLLLVGGTADVIVESGIGRP